jgi:hypothetical protein
MNDIQVRASLLQGLEYISNLIARCTLIEHVFSNKDLLSQQEFANHLTDLYARVLQYLAIVISYFKKSAPGKFERASFVVSMTANIMVLQGRLATDAAEFASQLQAINEKEQEVGKIIQITTAESVQIPFLRSITSFTTDKMLLG